jgi:aspartate/methionine/tyrosine aminotransferase
MTMVAERLRPFGTTIFTEMTLLAQKHGAVNLAQGFPDFDGPEFVKRAGIEAIQAGHNQYARMFGAPALNAALARRWKARTGRDVDPDAEITVTSGCTEAIAAAFLGLVNLGDVVILIEPFYDAHRAGVALAGATPRIVTLRPPAPGHEHEGFTLDLDELARAFRAEPRPRAIVVNTPHNPTGKVFTRAELEAIASLCAERDVLAFTDEVYEDLTYDPALPHVHLAALPGMAERTVTLSSLGKGFSLTGWKIGWAIAPPALTRGVRAAHQFLTFATATPLQLGAIVAFEHGAEYLRDLRAQFRAQRDELSDALRAMGLRVFASHGTYFVMADFSAICPRLGVEDDRAFCRVLTERAGVTAIPPSVFYENAAHGRHLVRFAYCKKPETMREAITRLGRLAR